MNLGNEQKTRRKRHEADGEAAHRPLFWRAGELGPPTERSRLRMFLLHCGLARADERLRRHLRHRANTIEIVTDYLAAGLDPQKSVIFQQSLIPEHAELHLLLGMVTPLGWLERVPTYKEQLENVTNKDLHNYGFLGYPCLQTADIVIYSKEGTPLFVPVGEDQVSHVELSREIVRKFNFHFGFWMDPLDHSEVKLNKLLRNLIESTGAGIGTPIFADSYEEFFSSVRCWVSEIGHENFLKKIESARELGKYVGFQTYVEEPGVMLTKTPRLPGLD